MHKKSKKHYKIMSKMKIWDPIQKNWLRKNSLKN
jgi:hypothetical protein